MLAAWGDFWNIFSEEWLVSNGVGFCCQLDDLVMLNNLVSSVGDIVKKQLETKPDAKVAYHSLEWVEGGAGGQFNLALTHEACHVEIHSYLFCCFLNSICLVSFQLGRPACWMSLTLIWAIGDVLMSGGLARPIFQ